MSNLKTTVIGRYVGGGLFEARDDNGKLKHSACVVFDDPNQAKKIKAIRDAAIEEKWKGKTPGGLTDWTLREGDDPEFEASYEKFFINPKCNPKNAPRTVIKRDGVLESVDELDGVIYPGCYVAVSVSAYCMDADKDKKMKACVCLNLGNVMFVRDGERLGGSSNPEDDFDGFESELDDGFDDLLGDAA